MKYNFTTKKLIIAAVTLSVIGGYTSSALNSQTIEATDEPPIVKEVERHGQILENHEGRITNAESDIKAVQENTGTAPAKDRVVVKEVPVSQPSEPSPAPEPQPVTITAFREVVIDADTSDCEYTYSDGTTHTWRWKTTVTSESQKNVYWTGVCNQNMIGEAKG